MRRLLGPLDILVIAVVIAAGIIAAVSLLQPVRHDSRGLGCINNVRNLGGMLVAHRLDDGSSPGRGPAMLLHFVRAREIDPESEDRLNILFCPVDTRESLDAVGGTAAYRDLDLTRADLGRFTSYAARDPGAPRCAVTPEGQPPVVLLCDDSDDHHGHAIVVGLSDGRARWWDKVDELKLSDSTRIEIGPDSVVPALRCLRAE